MLLSKMLERVHRGLGDRALDLSDVEITEYLNTVWQFQVPDIVPGFLREQVFELVPVIGTKVYNLDTNAAFQGRCRSTTKDLYQADGDFLRYYTDQQLFYNCYSPDDFTQGRPLSVLSYGRDLTFGPTPDSIESIFVTCIAYQVALTSAGLANDNHAFMVVRGAIRDMAGDLGYDEIFQRFAALFDQSVRRVSAQTLSRLPGTIPRTKDF